MTLGNMRALALPISPTSALGLPTQTQCSPTLLAGINKRSFAAITQLSSCRRLCGSPRAQESLAACELTYDQAARGRPLSTARTTHRMRSPTTLI